MNGVIWFVLVGLLLACAVVYGATQSQPVDCVWINGVAVCAK
jgi:hypothetical protein